ncbi:MAG: glycoside hydrolase, partial [Actinomycetia bacterium]|nr:glycoside hydrolase [Actinomycetes bacterium]
MVPTSPIRRFTALAIVMAVVGSFLLVLPPTRGYAAQEWTEPQDLSAISPYLKNPAVAISADGRRQTAVWTTLEEGARVTQAVSSSDSGLSWSDPVNLSDSNPSFEAETAQIVSSADGLTLTAIWSYPGFEEGFSADSSQSATSADVGSGRGLSGGPSQSATSADVGSEVAFPAGPIQSASSTDGGATWSAPVDISSSTEWSLGPQLTGSADGSKVTAVWMGFDTDTFLSDVLGAVSEDGGLTWSAATQLSAGGPDSDSYAPHVAISDDGSRITAVWDRFDGSNYIVQSRTSTDGGMSWGNPVDHSAAGSEGWNARVTSSADGNHLTIAWKYLDGEDWITQVSSSSNGGTSWGATKDLSATGGDAGNPLITGSDNGNRVTVLWKRDDESSEVAQTASTTDGGATWGAPVDLSQPGGDVDDPQIASTEDGRGLTVVWDRNDGLVEATSSTDAGASWSGPVAVSNSSGRGPVVASSANGTALTTVWQHYDGSEYVVRAASLVAPGVGIAPQAKSFGEVAVGSQAGPAAITVTNDGNAPLSVSAV